MAAELIHGMTQEDFDAQCEAWLTSYVADDIARVMAEVRQQRRMVAKALRKLRQAKPATVKP